MAAMIGRISRISLLESSSVCLRACSATAIPTRTKAAARLPYSFALNKVAQRSFCAFPAYKRSTSCYALNVTPKNDSGDNHRPNIQLYPHPQRREFGSKQTRTETETATKNDGPVSGVRFSTLLSKHLGLSRRQSERMILTERVTFFGKILKSPTFELRPSPDPKQDSSTAVKVDGKLIKGVDVTLKKLYAEHVKNGVVSTSSAIDKKKVNENFEYSNTRVWLANKLKGELITEVSKK